MPIYKFNCDCGHSEECMYSIKTGPPSEKYCIKCKSKMSQEYSGMFILKGDGFPGKDLRQGSYNAGRDSEQMQEVVNQNDKDQRIVNEVAEIRRKGKRATRDLKEKDPYKYKQYRKAIKKGVRAPKPKF